MDLLQSYEALLELSSQMVDAARRQEWDALDQLQQQRTVLIAALPDEIPSSAHSQATDVADIIRRIQLHDATILEHATASREQIGDLIKHFSRTR